MWGRLSVAVWSIDLDLGFHLLPNSSISYEKRQLEFTFFFWIWLSKNKNNLKSQTWIYSAVYSLHTNPLDDIGHVLTAGQKCWLNWPVKARQHPKCRDGQSPPVQSQALVLGTGWQKLDHAGKPDGLSECVSHCIFCWHSLAALWCPVTVIKTFSKSAGDLRSNHSSKVRPNRFMLMGSGLQVRSSPEQPWPHLIPWQLQESPLGLWLISHSTSL